MIGKLMCLGISLTALGFMVYSIKEKSWKRAAGELLMAAIFAYLLFRK